MRSFAFRPRWIVLHLAVLAMTALFVSLGLWQLRRLDERREFNSRIRTQAELPPVEDPSDGDLAYRRAELTGRYDADGEVVLRNRTLHGRAGNHVLTPLVLDDGTAVIVDRGWVPLELDEPPVAEAAPPDGEVTVSGVLRPEESRRPLSGDDPATGTLRTVRRVDPGRLDRQLPYDVARLWLLRQDPDAPSDQLPVPAELPELSDGPHLPYAIQWFAFIPIAWAVYVVLLRRGRGKAQSPQAAPSQQGSM
jgi:surfeit locus 1 family protein